MQIVQENELIQSLQNMITLYLRKNPQITLNALAQRSNVPVTSLRRLKSGQQKNEVAPHSVLNLVSYILREKKLATLLEKVDICIADFLRKHFGHFIFSSESRVYSSELNEELKDETKYLVYKLAANHNGTDLMSIVENFGVHGKRKADEMVKIGLLVQDGDRLHAKEKNFSLDLQLAVGHLPALVRFYRPASIHLGLNTFFNMSESLTKEAILQIKQLQRECVMKMNAIMNDPDSLGDIPYFTINLAETMLSDAHTTGELQ